MTKTRVQVDLKYDFTVVGEVTELLEAGKEDDAKELALSYISDNLLNDSIVAKNIHLTLMK